jgi:hypothetical protein
MISHIAAYSNFMTLRSGIAGADNDNCSDREDHDVWNQVGKFVVNGVLSSEFDGGISMGLLVFYTKASYQKLRSRIS